MIRANITNTSSVNKVNAKVELYRSSTLVETCTCNDRLQGFTVERMGLNNKFFGFGIIHKLNVILIDLDRTLTIAKGDSFKAYFGYDTFISPYPTFYVAEATRDETTNAITIVAYDKLYAANDHIVSEVSAPYTLNQFVAAAVPLLGVADVVFEGVYDNIFETNYPNGGNFEGAENYREALNAAAEVTQTIYFLNSNDELVFKRLSRDGNPVLTISKDDYYELDSGETRVLAAITNTNELGDSTSAEVDGVTGVVQYVRDNPFWELREDIETLLARAATAIGGIAATPFYCDWDGNFLLQIGDKIAIIAEDNSRIISYLLNDTIRYDGILAEATQFIHDGKDETASNPLSLGDALKQTYAKVDKQNKEIQLVVSESAENKKNIASLTLDMEGIKLAIENLEDASVGDFTKLTERVAALELSDTEIKASVQENTTAVEAVETDLATIETDLGIVETNVGTLTANVAENTQNIGGLTTDVANNTTNITTLTGTVTTHGTKIGELTTTTEEISAKVTDVESSVTTLEDDLGTTNATVTEHTTKIGELTTTTESISASVSSVSEKTTALETKTGTLESGLTEANTKITANATAIGELNVSTEEISGKVENVETKTTELETKTTTIEGTVTEQGNKITANETALGELKVSTEEISGKVTNLETTTTELTTTVETLDGTVTEQGTTITENSTKIGELTTTTESISASVSTIQTNVTNLTTTTETLSGTVTQQGTLISNNTTNISSLNTTVQGINASVTNLKTTTQTHATRINDISGTVTEHTNTLTSHAEDIAALEVTNESITASVSTLNSKTSVLETDFQTLDGAVTKQGQSITTNSENIAALQIRDNEILASVSSLEEKTETQIDGLETNYTSLEEKVSAKITKDDLTIAIEKERANGAEKVKTSTGFTFDNNGLTIEKSDSEISTNIDEDGLSVFKYNQEVLTADNTGVKAQNLHATTYLIIGTNTYFADYTENGKSRAGCFWTGK